MDVIGVKGIAAGLNLHELLLEQGASMDVSPQLDLGQQAHRVGQAEAGGRQQSTYRLCQPLCARRVATEEQGDWPLLLVAST